MSTDTGFYSIIDYTVDGPRTGQSSSTPSPSCRTVGSVSIPDTDPRDST
ncbi:hypothetical protein ABIC28_002878 [Rhodococcus sp. PvR044]|jgi:hypothetical protein